MRFILHSDLNNFYASVECLFNPDIRNLPVVVVGDEEKRHGIVLSKNNIAKEKGVMTGEPIWESRVKVGENLVCVGANFQRYIEFSQMVKDIYRTFSDKVESFGIDEAWIDITHLAKNFKEAEDIANKIRLRVLNEIGITVSIGVSFNKVFAKLGSDLKKPNAVSVITDQNYKTIVWSLPVQDLIYVGRKTRQKLNNANIFKIGDLAKTDLIYLQSMLGKKPAKTLYDFANGYENSEVKMHTEKEKSIGNSTTCPRDLKTEGEVKAILYMLAENVAKRMTKKNYWCEEVSVSIKNAKLETIERQAKLNHPVNNVNDIAECAYELFLKHYDWETTVRALGVRVAKFCEEPGQISMFELIKPEVPKSVLDDTINKIRNKYGYDIIKRGNIAKDIEFLEMNPDAANHKIHPVTF